MRERVQIRISPGPQQESQDLTSFLPQWPVFHCVGAHSGRCRLRHTGTFPERRCRRVVLPLTDCASLLCWWCNHTQMRKTDHAISLMSPSGCYIKVQFRVTRPEQSAAANVVTFLLKSATPPFNSVTRCVSLSRTFTFKENAQMHTYGPGSASCASRLGSFGWDDCTSVRKEIVSHDVPPVYCRQQMRSNQAF